jgi:hypothetical protein
VGYVTLSYTPWRRGFDSAYGFFANGVDYFTKCSYRAAVRSSRDPAAPRPTPGTLVLRHVLRSEPRRAECGWRA